MIKNIIAVGICYLYIGYNLFLLPNYFLQTRLAVPCVQHLDGRSDQNRFAWCCIEGDQERKSVVACRKVRRCTYVRTQRLGSRVPSTDQLYQGPWYIYNVWCCWRQTPRRHRQKTFNQRYLSTLIIFFTFYLCVFWVYRL